MKTLNRIIILGTALLLVACNSYSLRVYEIPIESVQNGNVVNIKDMRPEQEKIFFHHSTLTSDCEFAISDLGDASTKPPRMEILKSLLNSSQNPQLKGQVIEVEHFRIIDNRQMSIRRASSFMGPVLIDSLCKAGPTVEGSVDQNFNPEYLPQVTLILAAKMNGKTYTAKDVQIYNGSDAGRASAIKNGLLALAKKFQDALTR